MHASILPGHRWISVDARVCAGLLLASAIAWACPFDRLFAVATCGWPALRAMGIVALALVGGWLGGRVGLRITPSPSERHWVLMPMIAALGVALACAGLDRAFRPALDPAYLNAMVQQPWQARTAVYMAHAFNEEVMYRLFLGSLLANVLILFSKVRYGISDGAMLWGAFALAQAVNVAINLWSVAPATVAVLPYQMLRFFAPGMVWTGLYIRRGFMAAEAGHLTTHLIFQPLVGVLLSH